MHERARELIRLLKLKPHPEGGYYSRVFCSETSVLSNKHAGTRAAITAIYFLLTKGNISHIHRLKSDEIWHFYEGDPLELHVADREHRILILGPVTQNSQPIAVVPSLSWQAARTLGEYTLVGCTVGPGFEFEDFELLRDHKEAASDLLNAFPELTEFV